jgi:hypothetical protein
MTDGPHRPGTAMSALCSGLWSNIRAGTRLALLLPVRAADFRVSAGHYAMLLLASLCAWLLGGMARQGFPGSFDSAAFTVALAQVPIVLAACLIAATLLRNGALLPAFAVAFTASDPLFELAAVIVFHAAQTEAISPHASWVNAAFLLWALIVLLRAQWVMSGWHGWRSAGAALLFAALLAFFTFSVPRTELWLAAGEEVGAPEQSLLQEEVFHQQGWLLDDQLDALAPQRPGVTDLYFIGAAGYALQETFTKELSSANALLAGRFDTGQRSIMLSNQSSTLDALPIATVTNLRTALDQLGKTIDPQEDVVMLFITTHGYPDGTLAFEMPPLTLTQLNPTLLARMLADSGIKWKIVIISACYSGAFIEPLRDAHSLIITAADASHSSFGCEFESDMTWFGDAFFNQGLRSTRSFIDAFGKARAVIAARERSQGYEASNPQMFVGSEMKAKLEALQQRLMKAAGPAPASPAAAAAPAAPSVSPPPTSSAPSAKR